MDNEITIRLPRAEADMLRRKAEQLGISVEEMAVKLLSDEIDQRCCVDVNIAPVFAFRGPDSGSSGE